MEKFIDCFESISRNHITNRESQKWIFIPDKIDILNWEQRES